MATSGSINLVATRDDIIQEAMEHIGVLGEGETPNAAQLTAAGRTLNYMVKAWQAKGIQLFTFDTCYLYTVPNQSSYSLHSSTTDKFTKVLYTSELTATMATSATVAFVADTSDMSATDIISIQLDTGAWHDTTIASVDDTDTLTIDDAIPSAAATGNAINWMSATKADRPRVIQDVYRVTLNASDGSDATTTPVEMISRSDFNDLSNFGTDGAINTCFYDPQIGTGAKLWVWPQQSSLTEYLKLTVQRTIDDFDAATDDADFPQEWYEALAFNLAVKLAPKYGASDRTFQRVAALAEMALFDAESGDTEDGMEYEPDYRYG